MKSQQVHHKRGENETPRIGEKIGMLLGPPYDVSINSPLVKRSRNPCSEEEKYTQSFGEKIGMLLCRPNVVYLNSPLATLRARIKRCASQYPRTKQYTDASTHHNFIQFRERPPVSSFPCTGRIHV